MKKLNWLVLFILLVSVNVFAYNKVELSPGYYPKVSSGRALSLAKIYVGIPDLDPTILANQKTLSVQKEDGTIVAVSQPIYTSAGGVPLYLGSPVTLLVDGDYSLKVLDSTGSQIYYIPSTVYSIAHSQGYWLSDYTSLAAAIADIGSTNATLIIDKSETVTANISASDNIVFKWESYENILTINTGITLTINGPFIAGLYQVFSGNGDVVFGKSVSVVYPEWWGAIGDGITDDQVALQAAATTRKKILISGGSTIKIGSQVDISGCSIEGSNVNNSVIYVAFSGAGLYAGTPHSPIHLSNLSIVGALTGDVPTDVTTIGVNIVDTSDSIIEGCKFNKLGTGIKIQNTSYYTAIRDNYFKSVIKGVHLLHGAAASPNNTVLDNNRFEICPIIYGGVCVSDTTYGLYCEGEATNSIGGLTVIANGFEAGDYGIDLNYTFNSSFINNRFETLSTKYINDSTASSKFNMFIGGNPIPSTELNINVDYNYLFNPSILSGGIYYFPFTSQLNGGITIGLSSAISSLKQTDGLRFSANPQIEFLTSSSGDGTGTLIDARQVGTPFRDNFRIASRNADATWHYWMTVNTYTRTVRLGDDVAPDDDVGKCAVSARNFGVDVLTTAPASPRNGMIVYADGTSWNPGSGVGFYGFQNGVWVKF